jgi:hypothetical protein
MLAEAGGAAVEEPAAGAPAAAVGAGVGAGTGSGVGAAGGGVLSPQAAVRRVSPKTRRFMSRAI